MSVDKVEGKSVVINTDNQNVSYILKVGSKKKMLKNVTKYCMSVHNWCENKDVQIEGKWILR